MSDPDPFAELKLDMARAVLKDAAETADGISDLMVTAYLAGFTPTSPAVAIHVGFAFAAKLLLLCTKRGKSVKAFDDAAPAIRRWLETEDAKRIQDGPQSG